MQNSEEFNSKCDPNIRSMKNYKINKKFEIILPQQIPSLSSLPKLFILTLNKLKTLSTNEIQSWYNFKSFAKQKFIVFSEAKNCY